MDDPLSEMDSNPYSEIPSHNQEPMSSMWKRAQEKEDIIKIRDSIAKQVDDLKDNIVEENMNKAMDLIRSAEEMKGI